MKSWKLTEIENSEWWNDATPFIVGGANQAATKVAAGVDHANCVYGDCEDLHGLELRANPQEKWFRQQSSISEKS